MRPDQNSWHLTGAIFKCIFMNEFWCRLCWPLFQRVPTCHCLVMFIELWIRGDSLLSHKISGSCMVMTIRFIHPSWRVHSPSLHCPHYYPTWPHFLYMHHSERAGISAGFQSDYCAITMLGNAYIILGFPKWIYFNNGHFSGWTGAFCETKIDLCQGVNCGDNGYCTLGLCVCIGSFTGPTCDKG